MARAGRFESRFDLVLLVGCAFLGFFVRALPPHLRDPLASTIRRTVLAPLVSLQRTAELTRGALDTYESRTISLDSLALQAMEARSLAAENETLRDLLAMGARLRWGFTPAEALSASSAAEDFTVTLTVGSNAGIRPNSPVVAPEGLVGMVHTVDPTMSLAIIWPHRDFRVSAMDADGNAFGIVQAHLGREPESYLLELRGVAYRSELKEGTLILSSGLGGVYPKGIPIGTVLREIETPEGWTRSYLILPAVRPQDLRAVMVLDPQRANEGVQHVWSRPAARDSTTRRIVAASDSIARRAAQAEADAARRQAAIDSIARGAENAQQPSAEPRAQTPSPPPAPAAGDSQAGRRGTQGPVRQDSAPRDTSTSRDTAAGRDSTSPPGAAGRENRGSDSAVRRDSTPPRDSTRQLPPPVPPPDTTRSGRS